jgi:YbbR domain-containing protein
VAVEPQTVNLEVPIRSSVGVKRVPVVPQVAGEPGSGFVVTGVAVDPQLVTLTGSSGPLDEVESVLTVPVNLSGATRTFTRTVVLVEPVNARIGFGEPTNAVVTVQIAPVVRPFQVSLPAAVQVTDIPPGLLVSLSPQVIQVSLSGTSSQLAQLDATQLAATVSARGLSEGSYSLVPTLTLPDGVRLAAPPPSVTVTLRLPPTATPSPTERPVTETTTTTPTTPTTTAASTPTATTPTTPTLTTPTP